MADKPHPIALLNLQFVRTHVDSIPGYQPDGEMSPGEVKNNITYTPPDEESDTWFAHMTTVVNPAADSAYPYRIEIDAIAHLKADMSQLSQEEAARGVAITAHNVLYGAIRETVMWITGRHPFGPLMLGLSVLTSQSLESKGEAQQDA